MSLLKPWKDVSGEAPFWHAGPAEPWFEIRMDLPAKGGWLNLSWQTSLSGPVCRPLLRFENGNAGFSTSEAYSILAGAPLGAQEATIFVPAGTTRLLISPQDRQGRFAFRLVEARWMALGGVLWRGLRRRPFVAFHALGAALIGRPFDFRLLLMEALNALPLSRYEAWRRHKSRPPEWSGFDAPEHTRLPRLRLFSDAEDPPDLALAQLPQGIVVDAKPMFPMLGPDGTLDEKRCRDALDDLEDDDLFMVLPAKAQPIAVALPALLSAAVENPEAAFLYGDEEGGLDTGSEGALRLFSGFDPLSSFDVLSTAGAMAFRVGKIRSLLAGAQRVGPLFGMPLHRPLLRWQGGPHAVPIVRALMSVMQSIGRDAERETAPAAPDVAIIIPTRDRLPLLRPCLESIYPTLPPGSEIIIVDNDSREAETIAFLKAFSHQPGCQVVQLGGEFNFSRLCNAGAAVSSRRVLVFLNNDTTILSKDWLSTLWGFASRPDIGAVGARLLYPSGRVQHSGVIVGIGGFAGHIDLNAPAHSVGAFGRALSNHSVLAVTGACLALEKRKFDEIGGFDAMNLPVELNDIDLCLRLNERGLRNVLAATAMLTHHESASRGRGGSAARYLAEKAYFIERWKGVRRNDPYWHPALSMLSNKPALG